MADLRLLFFSKKRMTIVKCRDAALAAGSRVADQIGQERRHHASPELQRHHRPQAADSGAARKRSVSR